MADINIQEVTNHINIETANGYNLEFNGPVVNMNVVLSNYYTKTETDALLNDKADKADTYTKSETNILLNDKADKADTYTISQINGMVRDINTAIGTKQNLITGAASTITNSNLTANRAVISNASGKVAVSNVTSTELGYLSGVTSAVQTQLNNKASTSLDNLSADGQMIIDSQNGTISNCVLEIPQNLKLELSNNVLTLKAGSTVVLTNRSVYTTTTTTQDYSITFLSSADNGRYWATFSGSSLVATWLKINTTGSGTSLPADNSQYSLFFLISDGIGRYYNWNANTNSWKYWNNDGSYPLCVIEVTNGVASFAKDSNGNNMIFNGAGFIGHHAFVYPNVKALIPNRRDSQGKLMSTKVTLNSLLIYEMTSNTNSVTINGTSSGATRRYYEVDNLNTSLQGFQYVKSENVDYFWNGSEYVARKEVKIVDFTIAGTTVTDFTIRQPYQGARNLLTDDLYKQIGDVETLLAAI